MKGGISLKNNRTRLVENSLTILRVHKIQFKNVWLLSGPNSFSQQKALLWLYSRTHCERFPLAPTGNKVEALGLNSHSSALDVLLNIPDQKGKGQKRTNTFGQIFSFQWENVCGNVWLVAYVSILLINKSIRCRLSWKITRLYVLWGGWHVDWS